MRTLSNRSDFIFCYGLLAHILEAISTSRTATPDRGDNLNMVQNTIGQKIIQFK